MAGYKRVPAADAEEERLRDIFYNAQSREDRDAAATALSNHIWSRANKTVEADRAKHPKAKRNAPAATTGASGGRLLP